MFAASKSGSASEPTDPQFNYVTMLLHGDGTNGAQNNTFLDSSPNAYTVTRNGIPTQGTFSPYGSNWSNYLDTQGNYLSVSANTAFAFGTGDFTVESWMCPTDVNGGAGYQTIIGCYLNASNGWSLNFNGTRTGLDFNCTGDGVDIGANYTFVNGIWYHVAVSRQGTNLRMFINGALVATVTDSQNIGASGNVYLGCLNSSYTQYRFIGYLSNTRVVKGTAVYTGNFTPSTTPLTAITNTSLLTCQSNRFIDNSSNNFTITPTGGVTVSRFSPFAPTTAYDTNTIGGSGYFNGNSGWLRIQSSGGTAIGTSDFTLEFWFYPYNGSVTQIEYRPPSTNGPYLTLGIIAGSTIDLTVNNATQISAGFGPPTNAWCHIAISRVSGNTRMFYNGVQAGSTWADSTNYLASNGNLWWNAFIGARPCQGLLAGYRLATVGLYSSTFTPPSTPPTAISGTQTLLNFTNAGIFDNAEINDLYTVDGAQISTSVVKYGTGSMYFDGAGDYLQCRGTPEWIMSGDWTIECWIYPLTVSGVQVLVETRNRTTNASPTMYLNGSSLVIDTGTAAVVSAGTITANTWQYVTATRSGDSWRIFINGTQVGATGTNSTVYTTAYGCCIGSSYYNEHYNGYIDDLRITKYCRYTANFTPPTAAFPNN